MPVTLTHQQQVQLKNKYELMIRSLSKEIRLDKKHKKEEVLPLPSKPDLMFEAHLAIGKFQRGVLLKLHQEGEFSDAVIRQVEREWI